MKNYPSCKELRNQLNFESFMPFLPVNVERFQKKFVIYCNCNISYFFFHFQLTDTLTSVRSVNKTDCMTLLSTFGVSYTMMHLVIPLPENSDLIVWHTGAITI